MNLVFDNINELQLEILRSILKEGDHISARRLKTLELTSIQLQLTNIRKRYTTLKQRKWSFPFAIGETAWHLSGSNDVSFISYYSKQWKEFADNGKTIGGSCYGRSIFNEIDGSSQWNSLIKILREDIYTRRAVLDLYDHKHALDNTLKDIACSCTIQFLYRNGQLDAIVYMRSNDVIWGLPYDIFFFTMLQEMLALELKVNVGKYHHIVGSMHLYERHFKLAEEILDSPIFLDFQMPSLSDLQNIPEFLSYEEQIRNGAFHTIEYKGKCKLSNYWKYFLEILILYSNKKKGQGLDDAFLFQDNPYLKLDRDIMSL